MHAVNFSLSTAHPSRQLRRPVAQQPVVDTAGWTGHYYRARGWSVITECVRSVQARSFIRDRLSTSDVFQHFTTRRCDGAVLAVALCPCPSLLPSVTSEH